MNTQQIRDEIAVIVHQWNWSGRHPIPDTLDAAVGVIEGAGWTISGIQFDQTCVYIEAQDANGFMIDATVKKELNHESARAAYRAAHWQLALACVNAQRKEVE